MSQPPPAIPSSVRPRYAGRFAPSPTGPLHAGSLVAALASWLDARSHGGQWLVRIEDIDPPRCQPDADRLILAQLHALGLVPDDEPVWQSRRHARYANALEDLLAHGLAYPCGCTRRDIDAAQAALRPSAVHERHSERVYPGTCRSGLHGKPARAWRMLTTGLTMTPTPAGATAFAAPPPSSAGAGVDIHLAPEACPPEGDRTPASAHLWVTWHDRLLGRQAQDVTAQVGDFVLRRADGLWAYQLAVVVDDADQAITHVVRGSDLTDNTPRQLWLQQALGLPHPQYLHVPLVLDSRGEKLSKQHGAPALDTHSPAACRLALDAAAQALGLPPVAASTPAGEALSAWTEGWRALRGMPLAVSCTPGR